MRFTLPNQTMLVLCGAAGLLFSLAPTAAHAAGTNLVQDGGFEQATPGNHAAGTASASLGDGWTSTLGSVFVSNDSTFGTTNVYDGVQTANLGGLSTNPSQLSQVLTTTAGQLYTISFFEASDDPAATLIASFGGMPLALNPAPHYGLGVGPSDYTPLSFDATSASSLTNLTFSGTKSEKIGIVLDDVSVAAVPEASTTVSFGLLLALTGLCLVARRKRLAA